MRLFPGLPYCAGSCTTARQQAGSRQQAAGSRQQEQQDGKQSVVEPASSGRGSEGQRARGTAAKAYVADVERIAP